MLKLYYIFLYRYKVSIKRKDDDLIRRLFSYLFFKEKLSDR